MILSESAKSWIKFLVAAGVAIVGVGKTAITASGIDSLVIFTKGPSLWFDMFLAFAPIVILHLTKSPQQGAALDRQREEKADVKAADKVETMTGIRIDIPPDPRVGTGTNINTGTGG